MTTDIITQAPAPLDAIAAADAALAQGNLRLAMAYLADMDPAVCWLDLVAWQLGAMPYSDVRCDGSCAVPPIRLSAGDRRLKATGECANLPSG